MAPTISKELLEKLRCPVCLKPLLEREDPPSLECTQCRRLYPIRDGLPILLVDEATMPHE